MRRPETTGTRGSLFAAALLSALFAAVVAALFACGCRGASQPSSQAKRSGVTATLLVTRDFGSRVILRKTVKVTGTSSVLDVLSKNAKVETAYGGGFVNSINGLASGYTGGGGSKYDWLYCVNGIQASVGAGEYRLRAGDSVWWDYHSWAFASSVPAVIGSYPEPFLSGHEGNVVPVAVIYADGFAHEAGAMRDSLLRAGVKNVTFEAMRPGLERPTDRSVILVGTWKRLSGLAWVADAAANPSTSGVFARFGSGKIEMYDCAGQPSESRRGAGAILATGEAGQPSAAWFITGVDAAAVRRAAAVMIRQPKTLAGKFGVVIGDTGEIVPVPRGGA